MKEEIIELEARRVSFFSPHDEDAFFEWIKKFSCIQNFEGVGFSIVLKVNKKLVEEKELRELLSLFKRYKIDMKQLSIFDDEKFESWFRVENSFWYSEIFDR